MIKANELRVGNWVNVPHGNAKIDAIGEGGARFVDGCGGNWMSLDPIGITPEILVKCGFEKRDHGAGNYKKTSYSKSIDSEYNQTSIEFWDDEVWLRDIDGGTVGKELKSLHQLQNLYFALTGEELNYQP